jgi:hypothetical protein
MKHYYDNPGVLLNELVDNEDEEESPYVQEFGLMEQTLKSLS